MATTDHLVARSGATAVVSTTALTSGLTFPDDVRIVCPADVPATTAQGASQGTVQGVVRMSPDSLVYAIPTSGTTGIPKLVGIPHGAVVRLVWQNRTIPLGPDDRTMLVANSSFDAATLEVWGALANGGAVVVPTPAGLADPAAPCAALERHRVTAGFLELPVITNRSGGRTEDNLTPHYPRSIRAYESQFTRPWCFWRTITVRSAHLIICGAVSKPVSLIVALLAKDIPIVHAVPPAPFESGTGCRDLLGSLDSCRAIYVVFAWGRLVR